LGGTAPTLKCTACSAGAIECDANGATKCNDGFYKTTTTCTAC